MRDARPRIAPMSRSSEIAVRIRTPVGLSADIAVFAEPRDGAAERFLDRRLWEAELADRLARVEKHRVARHAHAFERHARLPPGQPGGQRVPGGCGEGGAMRRCGRGWRD